MLSADFRRLKASITRKRQVNVHVMKSQEQGARLWLTVLVVIVHTAGGAYAQWVQSPGIGIQAINAFASHETLIFAGGLGGVYLGDSIYVGGAFRSSDTGMTWVPIDSGFPFSITVGALALNGQRLYAGTSNGVYVSTDMGTSWKEVNSGLDGWMSPLTGRMSRYISAILVFGSRILVGTDGGGVYCSTDDGTSWIPHNSGFSGWIGTAISAFGVGGSRIFAGTHGGTYVSVDSGATWVRVTQGPGVATSFARNDAYLFEGDEDYGVLCSSNDGTTWHQCDSGLTSLHVLSLAISGTYVFAGTMFGGVFLSTNFGESWNGVNAGLAGPAIGFLDVGTIVIAGKYVIAGTGDGIWRRPLPDFVTSVSTNQVHWPLEFRLEQNYPNPFNPSTTIQYALPSRSHVTLLVCNTLGQRVAVLQSGEQEAGYHEVRFDG